MATHELKSWPEFWEPLYTGKKTFELRKADRNYQIGDLLRLREWEPSSKSNGGYTGREITKRVCYVMHGLGTGCIEPLKGLSRGYCVLGLMDTTL